jgi:hypothetical protein
MRSAGTAAASWQQAAGSQTASRQRSGCRRGSHTTSSNRFCCLLPAACCPLTACLLAVTAIGALTMTPAYAQSPADGRTITVSAPEPKRFVLALDELELDWAAAGDARATMARDVASVPGVRAIQRSGLRAAVTLSSSSEPDLVAACRAAETANPGAEGRLVLYEEGEPRSERTRHLLTREVAIVVHRDMDVAGLVTQLGVEPARPVSGVPTAWIILAKDPLGSLRLAETASGIAGVQLAYPLLRQKQELR